MSIQYKLKTIEEIRNIPNIIEIYLGFCELGSHKKLQHNTINLWKDKVFEVVSDCGNHLFVKSGIEQYHLTKSFINIYMEKL